MVMKTAVAITLMFLFLVAAVVIAVISWVSIGDVDISLFGIVTMIVGSVLTLALGGGLMALVFYSNRSGHDDDAGH